MIETTLGDNHQGDTTLVVYPQITSAKRHPRVVFVDERVIDQVHNRQVMIEPVELITNAHCRVCCDRQCRESFHLRLDQTEVVACDDDIVCLGAIGYHNIPFPDLFDDDIGGESATSHDHDHDLLETEHRIGLLHRWYVKSISFGGMVWTAFATK